MRGGRVALVKVCSRCGSISISAEGRCRECSSKGPFPELDLNDLQAFREQLSRRSTRARRRSSAKGYAFSSVNKVRLIFILVLLALVVFLAWPLLAALF